MDDFYCNCSTSPIQNSNEALHGLVRSKYPRTTFTSKTNVESPVGEATCQFNIRYFTTITHFKY